MRVVGQFEAQIKYSDQSARLSLIVVEGNGPSLFESTRHKEVPIHYTTTTTVILRTQVDINIYSKYAHVE